MQRCRCPRMISHVRPGQRNVILAHMQRRAFTLALGVCMQRGATNEDSCTAFDRTVLTPCCRTHPAVGTLWGREESAGHGLSGVACWHLIRLDTNTHSFLNQWGPGCVIQTRQRESVLFARDDNTTVPATAVWPGRVLFGQVSELFSQGPPALGSVCRPRVSAFCNSLGGVEHAKCCHEQREQFSAASVFLSA